jgi:hypothetical protein
MISAQWRLLSGTKFSFVPALTAALAASILPALAQGSPVPGGGGAAAPYAGQYAPASTNYGAYGQSAQASQTAGTTAAASAPVPGAGHTAAAANTGGKGPNSKYRELPITADSAKYRLEELRSMLAVTRPQDMQENVQELCEWLNDAADAHYRMYLAFAKSDLTKTQAGTEKQLNQHFSQLKREAQLLRADLLIKQMRAPEALAPLVDIVVADPRSNTGKEAYKRLVDLGFSQAANPPAQPSSTALTPEADTIMMQMTAPVKAPATVPVVPPKDMKSQANSQPTKALH